MKKRFAAIFLTLALCMGLAVPAFAADLPGGNEEEFPIPSFEDQFPGVTLSYTLGSGYTAGFDTGAKVDKQFQMEIQMPYADPKVDAVELSYYAILGDTEFTLSFSGSSMDDGVIDVSLISYVNRGDGVYVQKHESSDTGLDVPYLRSDGSFSRESADEAWPMAGDTVKFTLPKQEGGNDVLYTLVFTKHIRGEDAWAENSINLMVDEAAVDSYLARLNAPAFTDVPTDKWYAEHVNWAVEKNITNGTGNGKFSPAQQCTHAQILTFLYRAAQNQGTADPGDMAKAVEWAKAKGMIDGSYVGGRFCTRADAVNYIWQAFGKKDAKASGFTDVPAGAGYAKAVDWAVANGITNGTNDAQTEFSPNRVCDRGTIVTFLHRAYIPEARLK